VSQKQAKKLRRALKGVTMTKAARRVAKRHPQSWQHMVRKVPLSGGRTVIATMREIADLRGRVQRQHLNQIFHKRAEQRLNRLILASIVIPPLIVLAFGIFAYTAAIYVTLFARGLL